MRETNAAGAWGSAVRIRRCEEGTEGRFVACAFAKNENCKLLQNRDRTGALNIGVQFGRLLQGQGPIRSLNLEEKELTLHRRCLECE